MILRDFIRQIEMLIPLKYAESWDKTGFCIGRTDTDVNKVLLCVDVTYEAVDYAIDKQCNLIVSHHPLLFKPVERITSDTEIGNIILKLIENNIAVYSIHTNFDSCYMGKLAGDMVGLKQAQIFVKNEDNPNVGIGICGAFDGSLKDLSEIIKDRFRLSHVRLYGNPDKRISKVCMVPGSGKGMLSEVKRSGCDVLVTGDLGHHECLDALEMGISIVDATHYGLEKIFIDYMKNYFEQNISDIEVLEIYEEDLCRII